MLCLRSMFARACQSLELRNDQRALICRRVCQQALARYSLMAGRALARAPDFLSQLAAHRGREEAMAGTMVSGARPALALHSVVQVASRHRSSTVRGAGRAAPCKYCKQRPAAFPAAPGAGACGFLYRCPARRALRLTRAGVCALAGSAALLRPAPQVRRPGGRQHPLSVCVCCAPDVTTSREQLRIHRRSPAGYCSRTAGRAQRDARPRWSTRRAGRWRGNLAPAESRRASMWRRRRLWRRPLCSRPAPTGRSGV